MWAEKHYTTTLFLTDTPIFLDMFTKTQTEIIRNILMNTMLSVNRNTKWIFVV